MGAPEVVLVRLRYYYLCKINLFIYIVWYLWVVLLVAIRQYRDDGDVEDKACGKMNLYFI